MACAGANTERGHSIMTFAVRKSKKCLYFADFQCIIFGVGPKIETFCGSVFPQTTSSVMVRTRREEEEKGGKEEGGKEEGGKEEEGKEEA